MNAAMHGMTRREIQSKMDEIIDFSGVERFLDTPVKRYSSGMYTRLAFAVAAHLDPDVLLVDEVLAVGDAAFQRKCIGKMNESAKAGRTVIVVSHNMPVILNLCTRGLLLSDGCVEFDGPIREAVDRYTTFFAVMNAFSPAECNRSGDGRVRIRSVRLTPNPPKALEPFLIELDLDCGTSRLPIDVEVAVAIRHQYDISLIHLYSAHVREPLHLTQECTTVTMSLDTLPLTPGQYRVNLWVGIGATPLDYVCDAMQLHVETGQYGDAEHVVSRGYPVIVPTRWELSEA